MVKRIWSKNITIKKVYEDSIISRFKLQSLTKRNKMVLDLVWIDQKMTLDHNIMNV